MFLQSQSQDAVIQRQEIDVNKPVRRKLFQVFREQVLAGSFVNSFI